MLRRAERGHPEADIGHRLLRVGQESPVGRRIRPGSRHCSACRGRRPEMRAKRAQLLLALFEPSGRRPQLTAPPMQPVHPAGARLSKGVE
jgi:hypothetical protein